MSISKKHITDKSKGKKFDKHSHHRHGFHEGEGFHREGFGYREGYGYQREPMYYGGGMYYGGDEGFGYRTHDKIPPVHFGETKTHWIARVELPGVNKNNVEVRVKRNKVIIFGKQSKNLFFEEHVKDPNLVKWIKRERASNKFKRKLYLPVDIDEKNVHAKLNDGLLEVLIDKPSNWKSLRKQGRGFGGDFSTDITRHEHHTKGAELSRSLGETTVHDQKTCSLAGCSRCLHPELFRSEGPVVIEHMHDKQVEERHIPKVAALQHVEEVHKYVTPVERVEVHKHVHPHERIEVIEHVHPRERLDIHEHVRPIITTEVHEHVHPEITREVHKDIYPPEIQKVAHRDVDLGEVERKVVEKDLGKIDLGVEHIRTEAVCEGEVRPPVFVQEGHGHGHIEKEKHHHHGGEHHHHGGEHHHHEPTKEKIVLHEKPKEKVVQSTSTTVGTEKHSGGHVIGGHHVDVMGKRDYVYKPEAGTTTATKDKDKEKARMENVKNQGIS